MSESPGTIPVNNTLNITNTGVPAAFYTEPYRGGATYTWRWSVAPGCYFNVANAPNHFHRFMQRVFLGLVWERV